MAAAVPACPSASRRSRLGHTPPRTRAWGWGRSPAGPRGPAAAAASSRRGTPLPPPPAARRLHRAALEAPPVAPGGRRHAPSLARSRRRRRTRRAVAGSRTASGTAAGLAELTTFVVGPPVAEASTERSATKQLAGTADGATLTARRGYSGASSSWQWRHTTTASHRTSQRRDKTLW